MTKQELQQKIQDDLSKGNEKQVVFGAFGDGEGCEGFIEPPVVCPVGGGTLTKFYGCDYYFKGYPYQGIVEGIGLAKSMLFVFPRTILFRSFVLKLAFLFLYLFSRKNFWRYLHIYVFMIYGHVVNKVNLPGDRYNRMTRELRRAGTAVLERMNGVILGGRDAGIPILNHDYLIASEGNLELRKKREMLEVIAPLLEFFCLFIEFDNAYRFPLQDILPEIDRGKIKDNPIKEIKRLTKMMLSRCTETSGFDFKIGPVFFLLRAAMFFNKELRQFVREFLLELNVLEIKMDESDWYFSLNRKGYNLKGIPYEKRLEERNRIDKERGHLKVKLVEIVREDGTKEEGISVYNLDELP